MLDIDLQEKMDGKGSWLKIMILAKMQILKNFEKKLIK